MEKSPVTRELATSNASNVFTGASNATYSCGQSDIFATDDLRQSFPAIDGMVFLIGSKLKQITLTGLAVRIRNESVVNNNLGIQVWISQQTTYNETGFDASSFVKIGDAQMVLHPTDPSLALIPNYAWNSTVLPRLKRAILYVRAAGPFLDFRMQDSVKAKNVALSNTQMALFAGSAIPRNLPYKTIPTDLDTTVAPIFSGKFYHEYDRDGCNPNEPQMVATTLELLHVINATLTGPDYNNIEDAVNAQIDGLLQNDPAIIQYTNQYRLKMPDSSKAFFRNYDSNKCIDKTWKTCNYLVVQITWKHWSTLDDGLLKFQTYQHVSKFSQAIRGQLAPEVGRYYMGYEPVRGDFTFTLKGVPPNAQMDGEQTIFLQNQLVSFFNSTIPGKLGQVFQVQVKSQKPVKRHRLRSLANEATVQISGSITGGQIALQQNSDFAKRIDDLVSASSQDLVAYLRFQNFLPGAMDQQDRYKFFMDLTSFQSSVVPNNQDTVDIVPGSEDCATCGANNGANNGANSGTGSGSGTNSPTSNIWPIVGGVAGVAAIIVLCCLYFFCCRRASSSQSKKKNKKGKEARTRKEKPKEFSTGSTCSSIDEESFQDEVFVLANPKHFRPKQPRQKKQQEQQQTEQPPTRKSTYRTPASPTIPSPTPQKSGTRSIGSAPSNSRKHTSETTPLTPVSQLRQQQRQTTPLPKPQAIPPTPSTTRTPLGQNTASPMRSQSSAPKLGELPPPPLNASGKSILRNSDSGPKYDDTQDSSEFSIYSESAESAPPHRPPELGSFYTPRRRDSNGSWKTPRNLPANLALSSPAAALRPSLFFGKPRLTRREMLQRSVGELRGWMDPEDRYQPPNKEALVNHLIQVGAVDLVVCYKMSTLQKMGQQQLRKSIHMAGVTYDPSYVVEKQDLIRVFLASGKLRIVPEDAEPQSPGFPQQQHGSSKQQPFTPQDSLRRSRLASLEATAPMLSESEGRSPAIRRRSENATAELARQDEYSITGSSVYSGFHKSPSKRSLVPSESRAPAMRRRSDNGIQDESSISESSVSSWFIRSSSKRNLALPADDTFQEPSRPPMLSWLSWRSSNETVPESIGGGRGLQRHDAHVKEQLPQEVVAFQTPRRRDSNGSWKTPRNLQINLTSSSPAAALRPSLLFGKPRLTRKEMLHLSASELMGWMDPNDVYQPPNKEALVDHLIQVGAVDLVVCYKLSTLQKMGQQQLRRCIKKAGVSYDPNYVVEKQDLIRVFFASGKLRIVPEDAEPESPGLPRSSRQLQPPSTPLDSKRKASRVEHLRKNESNSYERNNSLGIALQETSLGRPHFSHDELMQMDAIQLKTFLTDLSFRPLDKKDLVNHLIETGAVELIVYYKLSTLFQMSITQLKKRLDEAKISYDSRFVVEKKDLVRIFQASGKLRILPE